MGFDSMKILRVSWTQRRTNAPIKNELEVPEGWLLSTVIEQNIKFFGHTKRQDSLEKPDLGGKDHK